MIGLLLGACFAFTVLQVATGEAQQCDPNPACVENCCGQCDPNPACVENCCPAGDPNVPSGNVTLDPNIDLGSPAPSGCDPNPACDPASGTCCNQCDPNPACVENCCPAGDPNASSGNVTLDPNIDPRSPVPSGNVTLDPNIDPRSLVPSGKVTLDPNIDPPQPYIKPNMKGVDLGTSEDAAARNVIPNLQGVDLGTSEDAAARNVIPNLQGVDLGTSEDAAARNVIPNLQGQVQVQEGDPNRETKALQGQWISCGSIREGIGDQLGTALHEANRIESTALWVGNYCGQCNNSMNRCLLSEIRGAGYGAVFDTIIEQISEIQDHIQCDPTISCETVRAEIDPRLRTALHEANRIVDTILWVGNYCGNCNNRMNECLLMEIEQAGYGAGFDIIIEQISEIKDFINDRC